MRGKEVDVKLRTIWVVLGVCFATEGCRAQALMKALMKAVREKFRSDSGEGLHPTMHPRSQPFRDLMPHLKRSGFLLRRGKHPGQRNYPGCLRATSEFLFRQSEQ